MPEAPCLTVNPVPMIQIRPSNERGGGDYGWLNTRHTFSFDQYHDPNWMGFRALRVINEDIVAPGGSFPMHPHRDMEIITYVLQGSLAHKDSMGNGSIIRPGDSQRMSAGTGVRHSEANPSTKGTVHLLQIWIKPDKKGHAPEYEQKSFPQGQKRGRFRLIASPDGAEDSVRIHQDAKLYVAELDACEQLTHNLATGRFGWLQVARGNVELNGKSLKQGDGAGISDERLLSVRASKDAEVLLFDLA